MVRNRDVTVSFTLPRFPELAQGVFMPTPIVVTLRILRAHLRARRVVGVDLIANPGDDCTGTPIGRPF